MSLYGALNIGVAGLNANSQAGNDNGGQGRSPRTNLAATRVLDAAQTASSISFPGGADQSRLDIHV